MKELKQFANEYKMSRIWLVIIAVLTAATIVAQAYFFVTVVERVFLAGQSFAEVLPFLYGLLAVLGARALLTYINGRIGVGIATRVKQRVRRALLEKYRDDPLQAALQRQSGEKVSMMMDAVDELDSYYSTYLPQLIQTAVVPLVILGAVFSQHIPTGIIMIVTAPFIPLFMAIIGMKTQAKSEEQLEKLAAFSGRFLDTIQGLVTLKLFGQAKRQKEVIRASSLGFREATMEVLKIAFISSLMLEFISMLSMGIIALEVSLQLIIFQGISFFSAFFVLVLAPEFYLALKELGSAFHTGRSSKGAAAKISAELTKEGQRLEWGGLTLPDDQPPAIALRNAGFRYEEKGFALTDVTVDIPPYAQVAIVGPSGSGKTTLLNVLSGLLPLSQGELLVDGKPLSSYDETAWFAKVSYISQQPYLFSGTIAENIAIGSTRDVSRQEIEEAARQAGMAEVIANLKDGYQTQIGEGGRGLSGGERQRIALARAFLKRPAVIVFDEPTTGLDLHTERVLSEGLAELAQSSTVITVAHRLHTIKHADHILFLKGGKVIGAGTHEQLLERVEDYRKMISIQRGGRDG
ncbi:thiol reductant ABC exporter subunit CydD [Alkalihalobacillus oceani]|uniref:Thiol reductant ABC exporter subunit CydD n=1 Tax=Halalkalibacter oceani TaxID=1653776 RepID=A0A9X2INT4_9BACI|nr:thiol reductant ABC exporter subunit CydD [Halalkalibacter oceani]MCM3714545.1 thiol reductant ABC exporter subunit CydD [Halalkalibacter oceani]